MLKPFPGEVVDRAVKWELIRDIIYLRDQIFRM